MLILALSFFACEPATLAVGDSDTDAAPAPLERRLRCNYGQGEGLTLADGAVGLQESADLVCTLGRYITLSAVAATPDVPGRLCEVGVFDDLASLPDDCPTDDGWAQHLPCAVNSDIAEPACVGVGLVVRPREGDARYRLRVIVDELVVDGDYLANVTFEYAP